MCCLHPYTKWGWGLGGGGGMFFQSAASATQSSWGWGQWLVHCTSGPALSSLALLHGFVVGSPTLPSIHLKDYPLSSSWCYIAICGRSGNCLASIQRKRRSS